MESALATMVWCDTVEQSSFFPSSGHKNSASESHQRIYWTCAAVLFRTARFHHPDLRLLCFSNRPDAIPEDLRAEYQSLGVEWVIMAGRHMPPPENHPYFRNNFNKTEMMEWSLEHQSRLLFLDSDCVVLQPLDAIFEEASRREAVWYDCLPYEEKENAGLTLQDVDGISRGAGFDAVTPFFIGGEFWCVTPEYASKALPILKKLMEHNRTLLQENKTRCLTEEHLYSALNAILPASARGGSFIRRIWTDHPKAILAPTRSDLGLAVWHLPAQKLTGFQLLHHRLQRNPSLASSPYLMGKWLGVPRFPWWIYIVHLCIKATVRFRSISLLNSFFGALLCSVIG